jgi:signal transduction histidine kinase
MMAKDLYIQDAGFETECLKFINIFKQSPIAIEFYNSDGILVDANQACLDLFGINNIDAVRGFNLFADPNLPPKAVAEVREGKTVRYEFSFNFDLVKENKLYDSTRTGICFLECFINPSVGVKGEITGYIVHVIEITERKNAEKMLEVQACELRELNATKDKLFSIIAHDLRSPFNAIIGFTDLLLQTFNQLDNHALLKGLKNIENASNHALKLLENLLIWSQQQTGHLKFNPEKLNLLAQVNESYHMIESEAIKKDIQVTVNIKKSLSIFADKNMIDSVLRNLISNAIKFTHRQGKIKITASQIDMELHVSITDNGVGMSSEKQKTIFEIEKHTNTIGTDNEQGSGLGLILCKDFIDRHNGRIWVESSPGKGSSFTFSLPEI